MNNRTIKIVTYCTNTSFGSIFQALGLKKELQKMNHESVILLPKSYVLPSKKSLKRKLKDLMLSCATFNNVKAGRDKCSEFIKKNLDIDIIDDISGKYEIFDGPNELFLAGSDQIWNPEYCFPLYFLDFVKKGKRLSYAVSMGVTEIPEKNKELFAGFMNGFEALSVREEDCKIAISQACDKPIDVHIDPTFLLTKEEWKQYARPYKVKGKYILLYMIYWDNSLNEQIKILKQRTHLKTIAICNNFSRVTADRKLYDVGPEELLWLIDNAEYIISSSFHGVALSINLNKQIAPVINPRSPSRIRHLMNILSVPQVEISSLDTDLIDYAVVNRAIDAERIRSETYLKGILSNE